MCKFSSAIRQHCSFTQKLLFAPGWRWRPEERTHLALCQPWLDGPLGASSSDAGQPGSSLLAASTLKPICSHGPSISRRAALIAQADSCAHACEHV